MPIRLSERSPNIDLHTCKMKIRHRCFGWRSSASRKTTEARRIERKHIQRWDFLCEYKFLNLWCSAR